jgi:hypothetical protein
MLARLTGLFRHFVQALVCRGLFWHPRIFFPIDRMKGEHVPQTPAAAGAARRLAQAPFLAIYFQFLSRFFHLPS